MLLSVTLDDPPDGLLDLSALVIGEAVLLAILEFCFNELLVDVKEEFFVAKTTGLAVALVMAEFVAVVFAIREALAAAALAAAALAAASLAASCCCASVGVVLAWPIPQNKVEKRMPKKSGLQNLACIWRCLQFYLVKVRDFKITTDSL